MEYNMIFAGFGGQGILLAGQLVAEVSMRKGKNVSWMPAYGPEMRGGFANCSVVVTDHVIGTPIILTPNLLVVMNQPSMDLFGPKVVPDGHIVYNSSLIKTVPERDDVTFIPLPCNEIAGELNQPKAVNMPIIGAVMAITKLFTISDMEQTMIDKFGESKAHLIDVNLQAIEAGRQAL
jgi:2-oxoglutarate ferredoxin oxidoreductase subunit gamma